MFYCNIVKEDVIFIELWEKKINNLIKTIDKIPNLYKKILNRYEINNFDEYIKYIKKNFNNNDKLRELNLLYKENFSIEKKNEELNEKKRIK